MRVGRSSLAKAAAVALVLGAIVAWARPARAACGTLYTYQTLYTNQTLSSCDGRFFVAMQGDGNFVVYTSDGTPLWASYKYGSNARLVMQNDGNLVVYDGNNTPLWASNTVVQNQPMSEDGNTSDCFGRCGPGCNWSALGDYYTSACYDHDQCVQNNGHLACLPQLGPAVVSYAVAVVVSVVNKVAEAVKSFFDWW